MRYSLFNMDNRVIAAKIHTKQDELKAANTWEPWVITALGLAICFFHLILGIIVIGISQLWYMSRSNQAKKLQNEIAELEAMA
jgi:hypothetical protein